MPCVLHTVRENIRVFREFLPDVHTKRPLALYFTVSCFTAHTHCTELGQEQGLGPGTIGYFYILHLLYTLHKDTEWDKALMCSYPFSQSPSHSMSLSRSRAVCMSHYTEENFKQTEQISRQFCLIYVKVYEKLEWYFGISYNNSCLI